MTKREICERLLEVWAMEPYKRGEAVRELLLDVAAPETEEKEEEGEPKSEEPPIPERPLLWVDGNAPLEPCPKCGANCPKLDERTSGLPGAYHYCQSCHTYFVPKRGEDEK